MLTDAARAKYGRPAKRYASDLTDAEFTLVEPHLPPPCRLGPRRNTDLRAVLDAICYLWRRLLLAGIRRHFPFLGFVFVDGGYQGEAAAFSARQEWVELGVGPHAMAP